MAEKLYTEIELQHTNNETTYIVERGDSLSSIADEVNVESWRRLYNANPETIQDPSQLAVGKEIVIPDPDEELDQRDIAQLQESNTSQEPSQSAPEPSSEAQETSAPTPSSSVNWDALAQCESNGNWSINTGNGFYGGLQFHPQTWAAYGGHQYAQNAHLATRAQQIAIAEKVLAGQGLGAWPSCTRQLGWR